MAKATLRLAADEEAATPAPMSASDIVEVKDSKGRTITLRTLSVLEEMRLLKMLGEYNGSYYNFCSQVARVSSINGEKVATPNSEREIEAIASRLGKEGVAAMMSTLLSTAEVDEELEKEQVKK